MKENINQPQVLPIGDNGIRWNGKVSVILRCFYAALLVAFFLLGFGEIVLRPQNRDVFLRSWALGDYQLLLLLYVGVCLVLVYLSKYYFKWTDIRLVIAVFLFALLPRVLLAVSVEYMPTSDFAMYYGFGVTYLGGDYNALALASQDWQLPSFSGLAVLNGLLMRLFSSSHLGFRIAHCVLSAAITIPLYYIGKLWNKKIGTIAAIIFAIYPSNIIFSQVYTNQHGSILCAFVSFCAILYAQKEINSNKRKSIVLSILSALFLNLSYFFHPSWHTHLIAVSIYFLVLIVASWKNKEIRKHLVTVATCFAISLVVFNAIAWQSMLGVGLINSKEGGSIASKFMVGFNPDTKGYYSAEDYKFINSIPREQQTEVALRETALRIKNQDNLSRFLLDKINGVWFNKDQTFSWYTSGLETWANQFSEGSVSKELAITKVQEAKNFIANMQWLDLVFCAVVLLFASFGVIYQITDKSFGQGDLLMLLLLGWISIHLLIEIQERYRYFGMPIIIFFAGAGLVSASNYWAKIHTKIQAKIKSTN